jgi:hypothetical protein
MTQQSRSPRTPLVDVVRQGRPRQRRRHAAGVVAAYIHELSERHAEDARRARRVAEKTLRRSDSRAAAVSPSPC